MAASSFEKGMDFGVGRGAKALSHDAEHRPSICIVIDYQA